MDVEQGLNKERNRVLYLVFEHMEIYLKKSNWTEHPCQNCQGIEYFQLNYVFKCFSIVSKSKRLTEVHNSFKIFIYLDFSSKKKLKKYNILIKQ